MARKELTLDPLIGNARVGFVVARLQGLHRRHADLLNRMRSDNGRNIIGLGSVQKSGQPGNPFTPDQRRQSVAALWGDRFKILMLQDIGATDNNSDWADYVFDRMRVANMPLPTDFYSGSRHDARWYEDHFVPIRGEPDYVSDGFMTWERGGKRVHILDRTAGEAISSSEVRTLIERRDPEWRRHVPAILHAFYEWHYPGELRAAVRIGREDDFPASDAYPVGTKLVREGSDLIHVLRDDGKWRVRSDAENGKSLGD